MPSPPLPNYAEFYRTFDPASLDQFFSGSFDDGINACVECCDRWAGEGRVAFYFCLLYTSDAADE